jgi:hypothetical protein
MDHIGKIPQEARALHLRLEFDEHAAGSQASRSAEAGFGSGERRVAFPVVRCTEP